MVAASGFLLATGPAEASSVRHEKQARIAQPPTQHTHTHTHTHKGNRLHQAHRGPGPVKMTGLRCTGFPPQQRKIGRRSAFVWHWQVPQRKRNSRNKQRRERIFFFFFFVFARCHLSKAASPPLLARGRWLRALVLPNGCHRTVTTPSHVQLSVNRRNPCSFLGRSLTFSSHWEDER